MFKRGRITNAIINIEMRIFKINEFSACILCTEVIASCQAILLFSLIIIAKRWKCCLNHSIRGFVFSYEQGNTKRDKPSIGA